MSDKKLPSLCYVGDYVVGVVSDCQCPAVEPDATDGPVMSCDHPHESHDIVPPRMEDDMPEGVDFEDYTRWCRMFAAAPELLETLKRAVQWLRRLEAEYPGCLNPDAIERHILPAISKAESTT